MKILKLSLLCFCFFAFSNIQAQFKVEKERAEHFFKKQGYSLAAETYKKAYGLAKTPEDKVEMIYWVGNCYRMMIEPEQAETWYRRALKINISDNLAYYYLGKALQDQNRLGEARAEFTKFKEKGGDNSLADRAIAECDKAEELKKNATKYVVDPVPQLNTEYYDFNLAFADKENKKVIIGSSREGATGVADYGKLDQSWMDLFESSQDKKGKWSEPVRIGSNVNTYGNEAAASLNADKDRLYFTRCYNDEKSKDDDQKGCDIFVSARAGGKWGTAKLIELKPKDKEQNSRSVGQPCISQDGKLMFFASDMMFEGRANERLDKDLYVVKYDEATKSWSKPISLSALNTTGDDMFPYLRDNGELYFASDSHLGMGGLDIYKASKTGDMEWGNPENMGFPINSVYHDHSIVFDGEEERGYLTSNRTGGKGYDDIYYFTLPDIVFKLEAYIVDKMTGSMIEGADLEVVGSDGSSYLLKSDENGLVALDMNGEVPYIKPQVNYSLKASAPDYLIAKDQISTVGENLESRTFINEFLLTPVVDTIPIEFPEVRYDLGSAELQVNETVNSKDSLNFLYQTLIDNPTIIIELQAHTDTRGGVQANQILSDNRAKSCVDYLIEKGIPAARLESRGFGESDPKITDAQIAQLKTPEEIKAAHQKNRRTEFIVLSWDYVPN